MLSALGQQITLLRPDVTPHPKKRQLTAAGRTATMVNSSMNTVRTSLQVARAAGEKPKMPFMSLSDV
jgi:hypothetical protein